MHYEQFHSAMDTRCDMLQSIISSLAYKVASLPTFSTPTTNLDDPPSVNGVSRTSLIFLVAPDDTLHNLTPSPQAHSCHHNTPGFGSNNQFPPPPSGVSSLNTTPTFHLSS